MTPKTKPRGDPPARVVSTSGAELTGSVDQFYSVPDTRFRDRFPHQVYKKHEVMVFSCAVGVVVGRARLPNRPFIDKN